jgi:peptidoglycan hydrolase-like protein with peptidoglycan-binding domain
MSRSIALFSAVFLGAAPAGAHPGAGSTAEQIERNSETGPVVELAQASQAAIKRTRQIQLALKRRGYDPGPVDGLMGRRTSNAIRAFQADHGLAVTGMVSRTLYELLVPDAAEASDTANGS